MPDITMCTSGTCALRFTCYRSAASGTKESYRQSFFMDIKYDGPDCPYYWPVSTRPYDAQKIAS